MIKQHTRKKADNAPTQLKQSSRLEKITQHLATILAIVLICILVFLLVIYCAVSTPNDTHSSIANWIYMILAALIGVMAGKVGTPKTSTLYKRREDK